MMKRLVAVTRMRLHLKAQQPVLQALLAVEHALHQQFADEMQAGLYTWELRPLIHQVGMALYMQLLPTLQTLQIELS